jgi:AraC family transcriptional regulator
LGEHLLQILEEIAPMSAEKALTIDYSQGEETSKFVSHPLLLSSHQAGWKNIHLAHYQLPAGEIPEISSLQHTIVLPFWKQPTEVETVFNGRYYLMQHDQAETAYNCIEILPAYTPISSRWNQKVEATQCYIDSTFLTHAAYESINLDRVEVKLVLQKPDPLVWQIVLALKSVLETDANNSKFYAESMATALAAHLLKSYSTREHVLQEYKDGLPKYKLKQALEYINDHFQENVSLSEVSAKLGMSQYYFCRLFKQSTGMTPHAYLVQQRIERATQLLKHKELTINEIASECGFANPSHFAKHFRKYTGISPKQFRMMSQECV